MDILENLNWRYAAKKMNGQKVPQQKIDTILEAIRLSASSAGLQPYNVVVIENHELKGKIHEQACPQPQIVECSHLLVFASWLNVSPDKIDRYMEDIAAIRRVPLNGLSAFSDSIKGNLGSRTQEQNSAWAARQAYIALGFGLVAAAAEKVDATPIEGFNNQKLDDILELKERGLQSLAILALGYRDTEKDFLSTAKKVRRSKEELFINF